MEDGLFRILSFYSLPIFYLFEKNVQREWEVVIETLRESPSHLNALRTFPIFLEDAL